jgi:pyruvate/2-oxoglutarate/acetoin dehydrogenase E1 component/TPP-dependent pyruvate/acetoin dehydrogenase alpha subunit
MNPEISSASPITFDEFKQQVLGDYKHAFISRECSLLGRREVLSGKAKFGIFGDGKELPQIAMAKVFELGDWRSGYYRDQTLMMQLGHLNPKSFFHGLYATTDPVKEPMSAGRQMGGHFMTPSIDAEGGWLNHTNQTNSSADISCTAGQMPRLLGLAQASKVYKNQTIPGADRFSRNGREIAWGTIGNASTSEGHFFEAINAAGVLQVPLVMCVWDDDYGISVPATHHTTKGSISEMLSGMQRTGKPGEKGYEIIKVKGWDYPALIDAFQQAADTAREQHVPVLLHVVELTQPQGHSTSGSHERYKSEERLTWEREYDCNRQFRKWIIENELASEEELLPLEKSWKQEVRAAKNEAWSEFLHPQRQDKNQLEEILLGLEPQLHNAEPLKALIEKLRSMKEPIKRDVHTLARRARALLLHETQADKTALIHFLEAQAEKNTQAFSSHLYNDLPSKATRIEKIKPTYRNLEDTVDGRVILRDNFEYLFERYPELMIFGEDTGTIGDVNQGLEGLQKKFGEWRVADTSIRETTIVGQGIGLAMRGLRPIAEIQYLDYIFYAIQTLSDDLATLRYRSAGKQKAPLIIRTRGHRLEGIWHSGSPMGALVHLLRGMYVLVPRNMTQAAGFYNTLMKGDEPALVIESLNGYRLKEIRPTNLGEFCTPIGEVQVIKPGKDLTVVSYGSTLRIVDQVAREVQELGIDVEVIDAQSLLPFDIKQEVAQSVEKTNRLLIVDEDVPGGCSAYLLQEIVEKQAAYKFLDSAPQTLTAKAHRPAYASDGDYYSKPSAEDVFEAIYGIMHEARPHHFPKL